MSVDLFGQPVASINPNEGIPQAQTQDANSADQPAKSGSRFGMIAVGILSAIVIVFLVVAGFTKLIPSFRDDAPTQQVQPTVVPEPSPTMAEPTPIASDHTPLPTETAAPFVPQPVAPSATPDSGTASLTLLDEPPTDTGVAYETHGVTMKKVVFSTTDQYLYGVVLTVPGQESSKDITVFLTKVAFDQVNQGDVLKLNVSIDPSGYLTVNSVVK